MSQTKPEEEEQAEPQGCCSNEGIEYKNLSPEQKEVSDILRRIECDPYAMAYTHLGDDGVVRQIDADNKILHAEPLRPALIKGFLDRLPYDEEAEKSLRGVDGTKVPKEQWYNPPEGIIPPPAPEEIRKESLELLEKNKEKVDRIRQNLKDGVYEERRVVLVSDHKIL
ncbi:uncharacterized protein B0J16DRAFT_343617 [Fusarium flagelliforme]|uniref:uncharacterized protein n=1 Tax=Fusarium flagelliforme TaxID=2675880 RepID=UPI001E8D8D36|nr:uncharacterized protein B0J16DRAFT_343617 [Fusarium flagelliforme]KAH7182386.1 hypothetical protein B0J16DRAFT_343617 [Fusarium flagelliforme]